MTISKKKIFIQTEAELEKMTALLWKQDILEFDTETTGLNPQNARLLSIQLATTDIAFLVPVNHLGLDLVRKHLAPLFANPLILFLAHNAKFDYKFLKYNGMPVANMHCTAVTEKLLTAGVVFQYTLKGTVKRRFPDAPEMSKDERSDFYDGTFETIEKEVGTLEVWSEELVDYALMDVEYLTDIYQEQMAEVKDKELDKIYRMEKALLAFVGDMELRGVYLDEKEARIFQTEMASRAAQEEKNLHEILEPAFESSWRKEYARRTAIYDAWELAHKKIVAESNKFKVGSRKLDEGKEMVAASNKLKPYNKRPEMNKKFNVNSNPNMLAALSAFLGYPIKTTKKDWLEEHKGQHPVLETLYEYRKYSKLAQFGELTGHINPVSGLIHCSYNQIVDTGRFSCIAEGSKVSCVGGEKDIEDVVPDDLVYCYTSDGKLTIRKVNRVFDNGYQECVKVKWQSVGNRKTGHLICTPDHKIKTKYDGWLEAKDLARTKRAKVYHLRRADSHSENGSVRPRLYGTFEFMELEQTVIKREHFKASADSHIHHINGNSADNSLENLEVLTAAEHHAKHYEQLSQEAKDRRTQCILEAPRPQLKFGEQNPLHKKRSKFQLLRMLAKSVGRPSKVGMDFQTFKNKSAESGIDLKEVCKRYSKSGYLSRKKIARALDSYGFSAASSSLKVGTRRLKELINYYGVCNNHLVLSVKPAGIHKVYDLEIEGEHNFIANEICVHNCSAPNLQQIPARSEEGQKFRSLFKSMEGYKLIGADYTGIELVILAFLADERDLLAVMDAGQDPHSYTMSKFLGCSYEAIFLGAKKGKLIEGTAEYTEIEKARARFSEIFALPELDSLTDLNEWAGKLRDYTKTMTYGLIYGLSAYGLSNKFHCKREQAEQFIELFYSVYPKIRRYISNSGTVGLERLYSKTMLGRKRFYKMPKRPHKMDAVARVKEALLKEERLLESVSEAEMEYLVSEEFKLLTREYNGKVNGIKRRAANMPIQGCSADMMKTAIIYFSKMAQPLYDSGEWDEPTEGLILTVHDELWARVREEHQEKGRELLAAAMLKAALLFMPTVKTIIEPVVEDFWRK